MLKAICAVLMVLWIPAATGSDAAPAEAALTQQLHAFLEGASHDRRAVHERFWADDLVYTSSSGTRFGKADILEGLGAQPDDAAAQPEVVYSGEDVLVRQYGSTAVVTFRLLGTPSDGGPADQYFNTGTFVRNGDQWQAVAWQATRIPPETE